MFPSVPEGSWAEGETARVWETHSGDDRHLGGEAEEDRGDRHSTSISHKHDSRTVPS